MKNQQLKALMAQQIENSEHDVSEQEVRVLNNEELKTTAGGFCLINTCGINVIVNPQLNGID